MHINIRFSYLFYYTVDALLCLVSASNADQNNEVGLLFTLYFFLVLSIGNNIS